MLTLIFFYLVLPFLLSGIVIRYLKKKSGDPVPAEIHAMIAQDPIEKKYFRAAQVYGGFGRHDSRVTKIGDFETHDEAVDAAFKLKTEDTDPQTKNAYIVLNDKGEILQQL